VREELAEPLAREDGRRDLAALIGAPELEIDVPIRSEDDRRERQARATEGRLERDPFRPVRVE
jgi:hypothetical protein